MTDGAVVICGVVLDAGVKTAVLAGAAHALTRTTRATDPARVHTVWLGTLVATLALPAIAVVVPESPATVRLVPALRGTLNAAPWFAPIVAALYVVGVLIEGTRLLIGLVLARRVARESRRLRPQEADAIGLRIDPAVWRMMKGLLRMHVSVRGPVTIGLWRPIIVLPPESTSWSAEQLRAVLLHEHAHIDRADYLVNVVAAVHRVLYWFNPASWLIARRLAHLAELSADRAAASQLGRTGYAEQLVALASLLQRGRDLRFGLTIDGETPLAERIDALLAEGLPRSLSGARFALVVTLAAGLCASAPARIDVTPTMNASMDRTALHQQRHSARHGANHNAAQPH